MLFKIKSNLNKVLNSLHTRGARATFQLIIQRIKVIWAGLPYSPLTTPSLATPAEPASPTIKQIITHYFIENQPIQFYKIPGTQVKRITMITDSLGSGSFYGGVGTSILFAALFCKKYGTRLRIITRGEAPNPENFEHLLSIYGIKLKHDVEFIFAHHYDSNCQIDIFDNEKFITTSWWSTATILQNINPKLIIYLLQEDERMFYPHSDMHLKCEQILSNQNIQFVINTKLLFDHLVANGFSHLLKNGIYFEPAFPKEIFSYKPKKKTEKKKLAFYARPNNTRNLFYFGINLIETAIERGIIDLTIWDIVLIGKDISSIIFSSDYSPDKYENLSWQSYADLLQKIDVGLSLIYTPHPSYPPLDFAASGAVAVTNRYANKQDLSFYSKNIICGNLNMDDMLIALNAGILLSNDEPLRLENFKNNALIKTWEESFNHIFDKIGP